MSSSRATTNMSKTDNRRLRKDRGVQLNMVKFDDEPHFSIGQLPSFAVCLGGMDAAALCRALGDELHKFYLKNNDTDA